MTNPVVLLGTQSNGETLPVQVDATGRLVAEGLQGAQGPEGPPGVGQLPPDPYEGAFLGWENGGLAWLGSPVPIPSGFFGPITNYQEGVVTVSPPIPDSINTGVTLIQVNENNVPDVEGWDDRQIWTPNLVTTGSWLSERGPEKVFNGEISQDYRDSCNGGNNQVITYNHPYPGTYDLRVWGFYNGNGNSVWYRAYNGSGQLQGEVNANAAGIPANEYGWIDFGRINGFASLVVTSEVSNVGPQIGGIELNRDLLVNEGIELTFRVSAVLSETEILGVPTPNWPLNRNKFLRVPEQRVDAKVLYGNDPTSLIDHLRQTRD